LGDANAFHPDPHRKQRVANNKQMSNQKVAWFNPTHPNVLSGEEALDELNAAVLDFWKWGFSDLKMNVVRGIFAEFLVARAVGDPAEVVRNAWAPFDVKTPPDETAPDGIRIEVKSSAYIQAWRQRKLSRISFSGLKTRSWSPESGYSPQREVQADVFVFALHTAKTHENYNIFDLKQWELYVVSGEVIRDYPRNSVGIQFLRNNGSLVGSLAELKKAIHDAFRPGERLGLENASPDKASQKPDATSKDAQQDLLSMRTGKPLGD
jgi:hypothetical protein